MVTDLSSIVLILQQSFLTLGNIISRSMLIRYKIGQKNETPLSASSVKNEDPPTSRKQFYPLTSFPQQISSPIFLQLESTGGEMRMWGKFIIFCLQIMRYNLLAGSYAGQHKEQKVTRVSFSSIGTHSLFKKLKTQSDMKAFSPSPMELIGIVL